MEDFYNQFRDNLENRPEPQFQEGDWKNLESRLDQQGSSKGGFAWWWVALPIFALLLASNLFFFLEWAHSTKNYSKVEILTDTVYQTKVIYKSDTVYQTRIVRETKIEYLERPSFALPSQYLMPAISASSLPGKINPILYDDFKTITSPADGFLLNDYVQWKQQNPEQTTAGQETVGILKKEADYLTKKPLQPLSGPAYGALELDEITIQKKKRTLNQQLYLMRPKGFSLALNAGWSRPLADNISPERGYSTGLEAGIWFSDNLKMWLEGSFVRTKFDTEEQDPAYGVPVTPPPADDFVFEKAEVPQPTLQYSVGLQYVFGNQKKWKPTVGMGFGAVSLLSYELLYEYENPVDELEWYLDKKIKRNELLADFLFFRAGMEYDINKNWKWLFLGTYRTTWSSQKYNTLNNLSLQTGLQYRF